MFGYNFELALHGLKRHPRTTALVVLTMALGLASAMTALTLLHMLSADPLPGISQHLYLGWVDSRPAPNAGESDDTSRTVPHLLKLADAQTLVAAHRAQRQTMLAQVLQNVQTADGKTQAAQVGLAATSELFPMFGIALRHGRYWTAQEDAAHTPVVVISAQLSQKLFGTDDGVGRAGPKISVDEYLGQGLLDALGLKLAAGRDFLPGEYHDFGFDTIGKGKHTLQPIIITQALADRLFTSGHALGRSVRNPDSKDGGSYEVVGIVRHLLRYQLDNASDGRAEDAVLAPGRITGTPILSYVIRTQASQRARVLQAVPGVLKKQFGSALMPGITVSANTFESLRDSVFSSWRAAIWLLGTVCLVVAVVTAVGVMGLTGYWVQQRTRQVGIRRALGARRRDILQYFLAENLLIVGIGVLLGMLCAFGTNLYLMRHYELGRLPWIYLPIGAATLWLLGQLAVLGPALLAAAVPPMAATRSV